VTAQTVRRGFFAAALAQAEAWLIEPLDPSCPAREPPAEPRLSPVVAVAGLAPRCGATAIARGLAVKLAARDRAGAAVVTAAAGRTVRGPAMPAAARLARALTVSAPGRARATGRLCLVQSADHGALAAVTRPLAPLVIDLGRGAQPAAAAPVADRVVLVASPDVEPALAGVLARSLARIGAETVIVLNRAPAETGRWADAPLVVPESRLGAQLSAAGHEPHGELGAAIAELAERCRVEW
jgi:hypothetical protein